MSVERELKHKFFDRNEYKYYLISVLNRRYKEYDGKDFTRALVQTMEGQFIDFMKHEEFLDKKLGDVEKTFNSRILEGKKFSGEEKDNLLNYLFKSRIYQNSLVNLYCACEIECERKAELEVKPYKLFIENLRAICSQRKDEDFLEYELNFDKKAVERVLMLTPEQMCGLEPVQCRYEYKIVNGEQEIISEKKMKFLPVSAKGYKKLKESGYKASCYEELGEKFNSKYNKVLKTSDEEKLLNEKLEEEYKMLNPHTYLMDSKIEEGKRIAKAFEEKHPHLFDKTM
ncbi:MAG: hypothetical protein J6X00_00235 [Clostridia bacterium]|nr:hypothetical protein [Clostridia bacterium]